MVNPTTGYLKYINRPYKSLKCVSKKICNTATGRDPEREKGRLHE